VDIIQTIVFLEPLIICLFVCKKVCYVCFSCAIFMQLSDCRQQNEIVVSMLWILFFIVYSHFFTLAEYF